MTIDRPVFLTEKQRVDFEFAAQRQRMADDRAREARIDAAIANLSDATLEKIREDIAVEIDAIHPRLGERARRYDLRHSHVIRARVHQIFFEKEGQS